MLEVRKAKGKPVQWTCGEEVYHWWMQDTNVFGQMQLSDFMEMKMNIELKEIDKNTLKVGDVV